MVTRNYRKRACGVVLLKEVKNPIKLAREMLVRGETDGSGGGNGGNGDPSGGSGGAQGHCCLGGETAERLAEEWGLDMVDESYFWTRKRWEEHKRGLYAEKPPTELPAWELEPLRSVRMSESLPCHNQAVITMAMLGTPGGCLTADQMCQCFASIWDPEGLMPKTKLEIVVADLLRYSRSHLVKQENTDENGNVYWGIDSPSLTLCNYPQIIRETGHETWDIKKRSIRHRRSAGEDDEGWDGHEYLPQGTVGCVALDQHGTMCVATSTGGLTNKLPCRIGDTPTIGAGFWAEEWALPLIPERPPYPTPSYPPPIGSLVNGFRNVLGDCLLPSSTNYMPLPPPSAPDEKTSHPQSMDTMAIALSGTGNGDSFLRLCAARTVGAITRFSNPPRSLASSVNQIAGPGGELQQSAGDRWRKTGEGEGGMIGIEVVQGFASKVVWEFNCGGMFRCWVDDGGVERVMVFREEY